MARTVNPEVHATKRAAILDAVQRLLYAKGYDRMTIQDILGDLGISGGAFYHYFESKSTVVEVLIERMQEEFEERLQPVVDDDRLGAVEKLQSFFDALERGRAADQASILDLLRVWYSDDNAIVRQKVDTRTIERRAPLLTAIIRQGNSEGVFAAAFPDQAGEIVLVLVQAMGNTHARLLLSLGAGGDERECIEGLVATHAAYLDAIERTLGSAEGTLTRANAATASLWVAALQSQTASAAGEIEGTEKSS